MKACVGSFRDTASTSPKKAKLILRRTGATNNAKTRFSRLSVRKDERQSKILLYLEHLPHPFSILIPLIHHLTSDSFPFLTQPFLLDATSFLAFALKGKASYSQPLSRCCLHTLLAPDRPPWPRRLRLTKTPSSITCPTCMRHGRPTSVPAMPCSEEQAPSLSSWARPEPTRVLFRRITPCT